MTLQASNGQQPLVAEDSLVADALERSDKHKRLRSEESKVQLAISKLIELPAKDGQDVITCRADRRCWCATTINCKCLYLSN